MGRNFYLVIVAGAVSEERMKKSTVFCTLFIVFSFFTAAFAETPSGNETVDVSKWALGAGLAVMGWLANELYARIKGDVDASRIAKHESPDRRHGDLAFVPKGECERVVEMCRDGNAARFQELTSKLLHFEDLMSEMMQEVAAIHSEIRGIKRELQGIKA